MDHAAAIAVPFFLVWQDTGIRNSVARTNRRDVDGSRAGKRDPPAVQTDQAGNPARLVGGKLQRGGGGVESGAEFLLKWKK
jgi:hypothetical protein